MKGAIMAGRWLISIVLFLTMGIANRANAQSFEGCEEELESAITPSNYCVKGQTTCSIEEVGSSKCLVYVPGGGEEPAICTTYFAVADYNGDTIVLQYCD